MKVLAIIPARGGSKGIPRKNIRYLNNKPLISYTIQTAKKSHLIDKVVVSTDDDEIAAVSCRYGAEIFIRPLHLASDEVPLDPVIYNVIESLEVKGEYYDIVLTIQPTSPLLKSCTLDNIINLLKSSENDTVLTATDDRHLSWTKINDKYIPKYKERLNRQYLPSEFRETGAVLASKRNSITPDTRLGNNISLWLVDRYESIDIDSQLDWWVAEKLLKRKRVVIRVDGYKEIGLGHIFRALTLAQSIMDHELIFLMDERYDIGIELVKNKNYRVETFTDDCILKISSLKPDIVINDILDTSKEYILALKEIGVKVFNFEDLGKGAEYADGVFNALYPGRVPSKNFYTGEKYYCARPEFLDISKKVIKDEVKNILITFGGTDPNNLTLKVLKSILKSKYNFSITIILGPGYTKDEKIKKIISAFNTKNDTKEINLFKEVNNIAEHMYNADIIFSSAGRTMYEIAMVGTPAIIISQNSREMTHLFGHNYNGFVNLGIHDEVEDHLILETLIRLIEDTDLRKTMNKRMLEHDLRKGLNRVLNIIFDEN